ncbi:protein POLARALIZATION DURING ASYMMETRIC DIVISION AND REDISTRIBUTION-like isoform X2 [Miscanthus floridulus]|uniref:protein POLARALIZATION DURING ASYMMETRIC DIVISION AND REDISTRIBUTION-like isoform X2 n=1 Tax=Miscanthus floridulus TaxID=154761 RepID=UPI003459CFCF
MASAGDGDIGEAAEATPARNRRTIYDYLGEGEDGEEASPPSPKTPPRLRLPTFTCARIWFGRIGRKRGGRGSRKEAAAAEKSEDASVDSSVARARGWKQAAAGSSGSGSVAAGQTGMGLSMLFLLARTCVELNRMAEVRAQMEMLLKEIRDEASRVKGGAADDHVVLVTPKACNNLGPSSTTTTTTASSSSCVSDTSTTKCLEIRLGEDGERASSEAEVEAEPAARRHQPPECKCDTEQDTPDQCSVQSSSSDDDGEFIELEGGRFGTGRGNSQRGAVAVDESDDDDDDESCERRHEGGVSATELERRLHELQHRQDRQRIEALESALRRAQRKLTEKEMEARLWQDTATLALGQPVPVPRDGQGQ